MSGRLDQAAQHVLEAASFEAAALGEDAVGTECLLLALATADSVTAALLTERGGGIADLRRMIVATRSHRPRRDHETLLETLGVDLAEIRRKAEQTFGADVISQAASRVRPARARRPLWAWVSCSKPPSGPRRDSPLTSRPIDPIPRVKRLLARASRAARPGLVSPSHLLLALITGNEPASEVLDALGVDLHALASAARRWINEGDAAGERAG